MGRKGIFPFSALTIITAEEPAQTESFMDDMQGWGGVLPA
jgi:hypothetical protein